MIETRAPFSFNSTKGGMSLSEIMEQLGETDILESWIEGPHITTYNIDYIIGKCRYEFTSLEPDGTNTIPVTISWYRSKRDADYIEMLLDMTKNEMLDRFSSRNDIGDVISENYELIETGMEGYYYKHLGFTFAFEKNDSVAFIMLNDKNEINGVGAGMDFTVIQSIWGNTEIMEIKLSSSENVAYKVEFVYGMLKFAFISTDSNGDDSILVVSKI